MSTNLAARPFRNERLPWALALATVAAGLLVSMLHGRVIAGLFSGDEARTVVAVRGDEQRIDDLETLLEKEPPQKLDTAELTRLRAFKDLVDRRVFPWRTLLSSLETLLPEGVRLTKIEPASGSREARGMAMRIAGEARSKEMVFSLAETLDAAPSFTRASLRSMNETQGITDFDLDVVFDPEEITALANALPKPSPSPAFGTERSR